jgi:hypothetical protein
VEAGYAGRHVAGGVQHTTPLLLKVTVADPLQLQVGTNGLVLEASQGRYLDDVQLLAKAKLLAQGEYAPTVALSAAISMPSGLGDGGYRAGWDAQGILYVSRDLGPLHADLNLALNALEIDRRARSQPWAALSVSLDTATFFTPMLELYGFGAASPVASRDAGLLMALACSVTPWLVLDAGGDVGLGTQERAFTLFVGVTLARPFPRALPGHGGGPDGAQLPLR